MTLTADGQIIVSYRNVREAKLAVKELRLLKKEASAAKRELQESQRVIRTQYTTEVRQRGSMMRGGGGIGRFVRAMQSINRDGRRSQLASDLAPLEQRKQQIAAIIANIDQVILQAEIFVHRSTP